jgi:dipeptidyl aminopeptidase/acylaminoacyl peptidase
MTVTAPPRRPAPEESDALEALEALIEEARRRARRRRQGFALLAMLLIGAGLGLFFGFGRGGGGAQAPPSAAPPAAPVQIGPGARVENEALTIMALAETTPDGWYGLSTIGADGRLLPLVGCPNRADWCGEVESIDWAPDGQHLAVSVTSFGSTPFYNGIHVIDVEAGIDHHVLHAAGGWFDLDWSPNGQRLAYVSGGTISLINADGSGHSVLPTGTRGRDSSPSWSPDGDWIAYTTRREHADAKRQLLYIIRTDGSGKRLLTKNALAPAWSPSGTAIAYRAPCGGIKLISPAGQDITPASACHVIGVDGIPTWSPDGSKIAIGAFRDAPHTGPGHATTPAPS